MFFKFQKSLSNKYVSACPSSLYRDGGFYDSAKLLEQLIKLEGLFDIQRISELYPPFAYKRHMPDSILINTLPFFEKLDFKTLLIKNYENLNNEYNLGAACALVKINDVILTRNSFIELMNDIHRVLKPNGRLFAISPVYPHSDAFTDPTHVNFITRFSHRYFVEPHLTASQYGFTGKFKEINVVVDAPTNLMMQPGSGLRKIGRRWHRLLFREGLSHILWEFEKV
jgi:SAM-dependent methyltransferase